MDTAFRRPRLRVSLGVVFLTVMVLALDAAPATPSVPGERGSAPLPLGIGPETADAAYCASNPGFTGRLTASSSSTAAVTRITNANVYGYISDVDSAWSCTLYRRYSAITWNVTASAGRFDWGTIINSTSVACNWVVGSTDYLKANDTADCADSDAEYAMQVTLSAQRVYRADVSHDDIGDFSFAHADCDTTPYYGAEPIKGTEASPVTFSTSSGTNRPGANCDPITLDGQGTAQTITYDSTGPSLGFDWPTASGVTTITSAGVGVQFDATDAVAGFDATHPWSLQRRKASWSGDCGTFANDGAAVTGTTNAANQAVSQGLLADGSCYQWTLAASDANGNSGVTATSGVVRVDPSGVLGRQSQHTFEDWDLGAGDSLAVNVATGNLMVTHPIASLPIRGSSLGLDLTYNRHDPSSVGMGPGWRLNMLRRLTINANDTVTFTDGDGARHPFTPTGTVGTVTSYARPNTLYGTLVKDTSISANEFVLTYRDGSMDKFDISGSSGLLVREEDRFGNGVTLAYTSGNLTSISDTAGGRTVALTWTSGNLTSITDWANVNVQGIVQTAGSGNRTTRFFYSGGALIGWADPLNTSGSCPGASPATVAPSGASHLTCITYPTNAVEITKTQTVTTLSGSTLSSTSRSGSAAVKTVVTLLGDDVSVVKDAQEVANATAGTVFDHPATWQTRVVRRGAGSPTTSLDTTTRYTLTSASDPYARIGSVKRRLVAGSTENLIEAMTVYDATYPTEPASETDNSTALLGTPSRTTTYEYVPNSPGLLLRKKEPLAGTNLRWTEYVYNPNNDVALETVSLNNTGTKTVTKTCYSTQSNTCPTTETGLSRLRVISNWVSAGATDEDTNVATDFTYDIGNHGQLIRETRHNRSSVGAVIDDRITAYEYDSATGSVVKEIANYANGLVANPGDDVTPNATTFARTDLTTVHAYDTAGNRVSTADPRRAIETAKGTSLTADDFITRWTYDALNQRVTEKTPTTPGVAITCAAPSPNCRDSGWTYDEFGDVRTSVDFGNLVLGTESDRAGRATKTFEDPPDIGGVRPADTTAISTYDSSGRILTSKDQVQVDDASRGNSSFAYDELGRQIGAAVGVGTASASEDDTAWDALDRQTRHTVGVLSPTPQVTITAYDLADRATSVDDGFTCTSTVYDYRDFVTKTTEGQTSGSCTGAGLREVTHTPDGLARVTLSQVTSGAGVGDKPVIQSFDATGRVLTSSAFVAATSTTTTLTSTYSLLDQVVVESRSDGSVAKTTFDPVGNQTDRCYWAATPVPDEACKPVGSSYTTLPTRLTTSTFDARSNRVSLLDGVTKATTIYDPDHNYLTKAIYVPTKTTGASVDVEHQSTFSYDERHRLTNVAHLRCTRANPASQTDHTCSATSATGSVLYEYDQNDNRTRSDENNGAASTNRFYCYDPLERLQYRNTGAACSSSVKDELYAYDDSGNLTDFDAASAALVKFGYTSKGQLCKVGASSVTDCASANVTYDPAGRTSTYSGWWYTYDAEGRLVKACKNSNCASTANKVEMVYDGEGRRTSIISTPANLAATVREFRYQGDAIVEERVGPVGATTVARQYLVDESGTVVEMIVPSGANAGTYIVTYSGHGDALALWRVKTDGTLEIANSYTYDTWGRPTMTSSHVNSATSAAYGDLGFRFLYVGEFDVQWDDTLGLDLIYMHARHYGPSIGRFLQPDPDRSEANLYAYATNNPVTEVDPDGTCFILCVLLIPLAVGAAIDAVDYLTSTDKPSLEGGLGAVAMGAPLSIMPWGKIAKAGKLAKIVGKIPKALRAFNKVRNARPDALVRLASQRVARRGSASLTRNFTVRQASAARRFPSLRSAYKGTQYHDDVASEVSRISRGRITYSRRGPDFMDRRTGIRIELTTRGQLGRHYARPGYGRPSPMMRYVRYALQ